MKSLVVLKPPTVRAVEVPATPSNVPKGDCRPRHRVGMAFGDIPKARRSKSPPWISAAR